MAKQFQKFKIQVARSLRQVTREAGHAGGFLILEYQKSSAPRMAYLASRIGVQTVSNKTPLKVQFSVFGLRSSVFKPK
jgi:hypothetical protein